MLTTRIHLLCTIGITIDLDAGFASGVSPFLPDFCRAQIQQSLYLRGTCCTISSRSALLLPCHHILYGTAAPSPPPRSVATALICEPQLLDAGAGQARADWRVRCADSSPASGVLPRVAVRAAAHVVRPRGGEPPIQRIDRTPASGAPWRGGGRGGARLRAEIRGDGAVQFVRSTLQGRYGPARSGRPSAAGGYLVWSSPYQPPESLEKRHKHHLRRGQPRPTEFPSAASPRATRWSLWGGMPRPRYCLAPSSPPCRAFARGVARFVTQASAHGDSRR